MRFSFQDLAQKILSVPHPHPVRLAAVDGPSASGKSTFAPKLAAALQAPLLFLDDFLAWEYLTDFWPRFEREALRPLLSRKAARFQVRDWEKDPMGRSLGPWREIPAAPVYVLEGIGCTRRAMGDRLTCSLWMETPKDLRMERFIQREGEPWRAIQEKWQSFEEAFFDGDNPRARAHFIVNGIPLMEESFEVLEIREPYRF